MAPGVRREAFRRQVNDPLHHVDRGRKLLVGDGVVMNRACVGDQQVAGDRYPVNLDLVRGDDTDVMTLVRRLPHGLSRMLMSMS